VNGWYGRSERLLQIVSGTAIWHHPGRLVPIRYVLVRDVAGEFKPQAFLCTDLHADPLDILRWFVRRWSIEVTFAEVRRHLGVETQRQWSDPAIARTTPALLGVGLRLDRDFIRSGPRQRITDILIEGSETKNGETFHWGVADSIVDLIELWMRTFRPVLCGSDNRFVFPGIGGTSRDACEFGNYLGELIEREVGAEFNMHVARHFAVVRYLRKHPGQYAIVSRLLGHKKVQTMINFYCGLEVEAAARIINQTVLDDKASTRNLAAQAYGRRRKRSANPKARG
jgi:hypothetical protein